MPGLREILLFVTLSEAVESLFAPEVLFTFVLSYFLSYFIFDVTERDINFLRRRLHMNNTLKCVRLAQFCHIDRGNEDIISKQFI